jgi:hypothetical protein
MTDHYVETLKALEDAVKENEIMESMKLAAIAAVHAQLHVADELKVISRYLSEIAAVKFPNPRGG